MQVHCDTCNAMIRADDMDLGTGLAKCRICHSVFALPVAAAARAPEPAVAYGGETPAYGAGEYGSAPQPAAPAYGAEPERPRQRAGMLNPTPGGVIVSEAGGALSIEQRWFQAKHIGLLVFSLFWWGFLVLWYTIVLTMDAGWIMAVFPLLHVAAGVFIGYNTLTGFTNRTVLTVKDGMLTVTHGPLPWPGNKSVRTADIRQLYCEERRHQGKNSVMYTYRLSAALANGKKETLMDGVESPDVPRFVEDRVERLLRIADAPVTGELRK